MTSNQGLGPRPRKATSEELIARATAVREIIDRAAAELRELTQDLRHALDEENPGE